MSDWSIQTVRTVRYILCRHLSIRRCLSCARANLSLPRDRLVRRGLGLGGGVVWCMMIDCKCIIVLILDMERKWRICYTEKQLKRNDLTYN